MSRLQLKPEGTEIVERALTHFSRKRLRHEKLEVLEDLMNQVEVLRAAHARAFNFKSLDQPKIDPFYVRTDPEQTFLPGTIEQALLNCLSAGVEDKWRAEIILEAAKALQDTVQLSRGDVAAALENLLDHRHFSPPDSMALFQNSRQLGVDLSPELTTFFTEALEADKPYTPSLSALRIMARCDFVPGEQGILFDEKKAPFIKELALIVFGELQTEAEREAYAVRVKRCLPTIDLSAVREEHLAMTLMEMKMGRELYIPEEIEKFIALRESMGLPLSRFQRHCLEYIEKMFDGLMQDSSSWSMGVKPRFKGWFVLSNYLGTLAQEEDCMEEVQLLFNKKLEDCFVHLLSCDPSSHFHSKDTVSSNFLFAMSEVKRIYFPGKNFANIESCLQVIKDSLRRAPSVRAIEWIERVLGGNKADFSAEFRAAAQNAAERGAHEVIEFIEAAGGEPTQEIQLLKTTVTNARDFSIIHRMMYMFPNLITEEAFRKLLTEKYPEWLEAGNAEIAKLTKIFRENNLPIALEPRQHEELAKTGLKANLELNRNTNHLIDHSFLISLREAFGIEKAFEMLSDLLGENPRAKEVLEYYSSPEKWDGMGYEAYYDDLRREDW